MPTKKKTDTFGQAIDADPAEFDIEGWLSGASLPARTVPIYQNAGLRAEYDELEQEFLRLKALADPENTDPFGDITLGDDAPMAELHRVGLKLQDVIDRMESSKLPVKIRALTGDEDEAITKKVKAKGLEPKRAVYERVSKAMLFPKMTPAQVGKLRNVIGEQQFQALVRAVVELAGFNGPGQVMPDFSQDVSELLATKGS